MNKLILTDCDGVLLNWMFAFDAWLTSRGYKRVINDEYNVAKSYGITKDEGYRLVRAFNESDSIGYLPPHRDAVHYIGKLHEEHGYVFRVITSLSLDPYAKELRERNLRKLFGTAIEQVICLDTGEDKDAALLPFKDSGMCWIEDKEENALLGTDLGLESLLMEHGYNTNCQTVPLVRNWKDVHDRLLNSYK